MFNPLSEIIIVSGLPRSGTSMMMEMLNAGGLELVFDNVKKPDIDNPNGYYEYKIVKTLKNNSSWIAECKNKVIKILSPKLIYIPLTFQYKIIFMKRDLTEIIISQDKMFERLNKQDSFIKQIGRKQLFKDHLNKIHNWLIQQENIGVIYINYCDVINNKHKCAVQIADFLGRTLELDKMSAVVDRTLYRNIVT